MPCPPQLAEWLFCKETGFQVMPSGLIQGDIDDQPSAAFHFWANLSAFFEMKKSRIEFKTQKDLERRNRPRSRR